MNKPNHDKDSGRPMPDPIEKPRPPEMDLEPIPSPDLSGADADERQADQGRVPPVPSRDEANMGPDEALPADTEEEILDDDPAREKTRFDEEVPKSSR